MSEKDIVKAVVSLGEVMGGLKVVKIPSGITVISSVPEGMSMDELVLLTLEGPKSNSHDNGTKQNHPSIENPKIAENTEDGSKGAGPTDDLGPGLNESVLAQNAEQNSSVAFDFARVKALFGWDKDRFERAAAKLLADGLVWIDLAQDGTTTYFPTSLLL